VNAKNTHPRSKNEVGGADDNPRSAQLETAENAEDPPICDGASPKDIITEILTRESPKARPSAGQWQESFFQALAMAPIAALAARIAGVSLRRAMEERNADAAFARRWDDTVEAGIEEIEAAAYLSAVHGERKPVFHHGMQIAWTVDYAHAMRSMLLKARRPEVFGNKKGSKDNGMKPMTLEEFRKRVEEARRM